MKVIFLPQTIDTKFEIAVISYFGFILFLYQITGRLKYFAHNPDKIFSETIFSELSRAIIFVAFNLAVHVILKRKIVLRCALIVTSGIVISVHKFLISPGIIDPVYFFVISAACAGIIGLYKGAFLKEEIEDIELYEYGPAIEKIIDYIRDSHKFIMRSCLQAWLALAASLGVSMTILFRGGWESTDLKYQALKMLAGFAGISFALVYWVALPFATQLFDCHQIIKKIKNGATRVENNE